MENDALCNEHEAAKRLTLAVTTLRRWRCIKKGPRYLKIGGAIRYAQGDLDDFIEASRHGTADTEERAA